MRVLAVDPGTRRIGLALSDEEGVVAQPLRTLERTSAAQALGAIAAEVERSGAGLVVVGLPLDMSGGEGAAARRVRRFSDALGAAIAVPVELWDERLTTVAAERSLRDAGVRGPARKKVIDQAAATILLQSYLDAQAVASEGRDRWGAGAIDERDVTDAPGAALPARERRKRRGR